MISHRVRETGTAHFFIRIRALAPGLAVVFCRNWVSPGGSAGCNPRCTASIWALCKCILWVGEPGPFMIDGSQPQILLVEDNGALRRLMLRILAGSGYSVLEAASGPQGLELFHEHAVSVDLAILDMIMPGMSGLDVAADIERHRPGMKILYMSGHASSVAIESISRRSPDRVLIKPFDAGELIDRVTRLLGPGAAGPPSAAPQSSPT